MRLTVAEHSVLPVRMLGDIGSRLTPARSAPAHHPAESRLSPVQTVRWTFLPFKSSRKGLVYLSINLVAGKTFEFDSLMVVAAHLPHLCRAPCLPGKRLCPPYS
jgi:hypothetical protein